MTTAHKDKVTVSHWNYRVMKTVMGSGEILHGIHEVYYIDGEPSSYSSTEAVVGWDEDLAYGNTILDNMRKALDKPVLTVEDFKK